MPTAVKMQSLNHWTASEVPETWERLREMPLKDKGGGRRACRGPRDGREEVSQARKFWSGSWGSLGPKLVVRVILNPPGLVRVHPILPFHPRR